LVASSDQNIPHDLYTLVTLKLKEFFLNKILESKNIDSLEQENLDMLSSYKKLVELNLSRKLVKLGVMVKPYNASSYQIANYIKENLVFNKVDKSIYYTIPGNDDIKLTNKDISVLTRSIDRVIYDEFPKLKGFVQYLKTIAKICSILNIPIV
jgi:hypothetical protein